MSKDGYDKAYRDVAADYYGECTSDETAADETAESDEESSESDSESDSDSDSSDKDKDKDSDSDKYKYKYACKPNDKSSYPVTVSILYRLCR